MGFASKVVKLLTFSFPIRVAARQTSPLNECLTKWTGFWIEAVI